MNHLKSLFVFLVLASVSSSLPAQKKGGKERISVEVIHDSRINEELAEARDQFALQAGIGSSDRFILMPLASIAYNMLAGKLIDGAKGKVNEQLSKSEKKYMSEWTASVSKDYFYSGISLNGPLDPSGIQFGGMKVCRVVNNNMDTAFYFSSRIDVASFSEIMKNSRFTLKLDTLMLDLSKTNAKLPENKKFNLQIEVKITASWVNEVAQYYKDQELGVFTTTLRDLIYDPSSPVLVFTDDNLKLKGSCFVIPRSYIGYIDSDNNHRHSWGQGEYSMMITIKEQTQHKNVVSDFFNEYVIKVTEQYGSEIKSSYGTIEALGGSSSKTQSKGQSQGQGKK